MCKAPNCTTEKVMAMGLCSKHYNRLHRTGSLELPEKVPSACSICGKPVHGNGLCNTHYRRLQRFGDPNERGQRMRDSGPDETRWLSKVSVEAPGCWIWQAGKSYGYGAYSAGGRSCLAHRYVYELLVGPIPEDMELDHLCRRPACVNPEHLEPVPHILNVQRGAGPAVARLGRGRNTCSVEGCEKFCVGRGLCNNHYKNAWRAARVKGEVWA